MSSEKVSLSLDADLLAEARRRVGGRGLSAYVTEGLRRQLLADRLGELVREWETEHGALHEDELAEARGLLAD